MNNFSSRIMTSLMLMLVMNQAVATVCSEYVTTELGILEPNTISEASGLIQSRLVKDKLIWTNDSGNSSQLYSTGADGKVDRAVELIGFSNFDIEALSSAPCLSDRTEPCIYVGDIGDGIGFRNNFKIGIFKERDFWSKTQISPEKVINYTYPVGRQNAEGMVVTSDGVIVVFSKHDSGTTQVFSINSFTSAISHLGEVILKGIIPDARGKGPRITDASLSADNQRLLLLTYGDVLEVDFKVFLTATPKFWRRGLDFNVFRGPNQPQQETISFVDGDSGFIVSTESPKGESQEILAYQCR